MATAPAIGIDLGTTNSCVAVYRNNKVEIITNEEGNRTTPSYISFTDNGRLIGDSAKNNVVLNPTNTVFDAKRMIGCSFDDVTVQADMKYWPFKVVNEDKKLKILVNYQNETKTFYPEEISAMVLTKMKQIAEIHLGKTVQNAVITVPAYFNDHQRQATRDAGKIAGLNVLRLLNEPTAAAIAYGLETKTADERNILIYDLGGGTFDVTILTIDDGLFEVKSTSGNTHLGGVDFDNRIVDYFVAEFKRKHNKDLTTNKRAIRRLRLACERAKCSLSSASQTSIEIDSLFDDIDFYTSLTRRRFEEMIDDLFQSTLEVVKMALEDAVMKKDQVDEIVLVGGSTRIPKVQKLLEDFFNGKKLNKSINPDESVAYGAAVQAAIMTYDKSEEIKDLVLLDVTPLSLGVEVLVDEMSFVIKRNTTIPTSVSEEYTTLYDDQTKTKFSVYEGERAVASKNHLLGEFILTGIPAAKRAVPTIDVTFDIDSSGILTVTAVDRSNKNNKNHIKIHNDRGRLSRDEISRMILEAEKYRAEDERFRQAMASKNALENFCYDMEEALESGKLKTKITKQDKEMLFEKLNETKEWLEAHRFDKKQEYEYRHSQLEDIFYSKTQKKH